MIGKTTSDGRLSSISEVEEILEDRKKDGELGYEQTLAYDYAKKFNRLTKSESKKMQKELEELGLSERLSLKVIEVMPIDATQIKLILAMEKSRAPTEEETVVKLMAVVKSYSK